MKNNIFIINLWFHLQNYGAILTAFALQKVLEELNLNNELLDFSFSLKAKKKTFGLPFAEKYIKSRSCNKSYIDLHKLNNYSDIFIAGSDQIFRYGGDAPMWLDFVDCTKKKIAFSASFGVDKEKFLQENSSEQIKQIKNSLKAFDFISVREKSGVEICSDILGINAEWIIDPVFILDKSCYDKLIDNSTKNYKNKIVAYVLDTNRKYKKAYKYLSDKYSKKVVETADSKISVENWLASIRDCDFFITDSFHGMCFAIIFNKPFICVANNFRGRTRFDSICEMLNIDNQCINSISDIYKYNCIFKVDYKKTNQIIINEAKRGKEYLINAINTDKTVSQDKLSGKIFYLENKVLNLEKQIKLYPAIKLFLWNIWKYIFFNYFPLKLQKIILEYRSFGNKDNNYVTQN